MADALIELKTTEGTVVWVRPQQVGAIEIVPATQRVEGHIKIFVQGAKFLIQADKDDLIKKLEGEVSK